MPCSNNNNRPTSVCQHLGDNWLLLAPSGLAQRPSRIAQRRSRLTQHPSAARANVPAGAARSSRSPSRAPRGGGTLAGAPSRRLGTTAATAPWRRGRIIAYVRRVALSARRVPWRLPREVSLGGARRPGARAAEPRGTALRSRRAKMRPEGRRRDRSCAAEPPQRSPPREQRRSGRGRPSPAADGPRSHTRRLVVKGPGPLKPLSSDGSSHLRWNERESSEKELPQTAPVGAPGTPPPPPGSGPASAERFANGH